MLIYPRLKREGKSTGKTETAETEEDRGEASLSLTNQYSALVLNVPGAVFNATSCD